MVLSYWKGLKDIRETQTNSNLHHFLIRYTFIQIEQNFKIHISNLQRFGFGGDEINHRS